MRSWGLAMTQLDGGDVGIKPLIDAGPVVVLAPRDRIHRLHLCQGISVAGDALQHELQVLYIPEGGCSRPPPRTWTRLLVTGQHRNSRASVAGALDLASGVDLHAVGVEQ